MTEDIVCSLELSKKLHESGVKLETVFYWYENPHYGWKVTYYTRIDAERVGAKYPPDFDFVIPAPTSSELGKILTEKHRVGLMPKPSFSPDGVTWHLPQTESKRLEPTYPYMEFFVREVDARAKMLWLHEQGLVK